MRKARARLTMVTTPVARRGRNESKTLKNVFELLKTKFLTNNDFKTKLFEGISQDDVIQITGILEHIVTTQISTPRTLDGQRNSPEEEAHSVFHALEHSLNRLKTNAENLLTNFTFTSEDGAILPILADSIGIFLDSQKNATVDPAITPPNPVGSTPRARAASRLPCLPPLDRLGVERARGR